MTREEHLSHWTDLACGLSLIHMKNHGSDEYTERIIIAIQRGDLDELNHVTALFLVLHRDLPKWVHAKWHELDVIYHKHFCTTCKRED